FYTLLGAFAEFERDTIRERVRAGLRHARARGKTLGRPRKTVDAARIASLRQSGAPWRTISSEMNIPVRSARRAWQNAAS
ncbi:MAG TPA: recombinase family protein, partial [Terriglobales bacterium]|nr:recombinase family protein [Terriglobales bacterium]